MIKLTVGRLRHADFKNGKRITPITFLSFVVEANGETIIDFYVDRGGLTLSYSNKLGFYDTELVLEIRKVRP